jgi:hypothetical protein
LLCFEKVRRISRVEKRIQISQKVDQIPNVNVNINPMSNINQNVNNARGDVVQSTTSFISHGVVGNGNVFGPGVVFGNHSGSKSKRKFNHESNLIVTSTTVTFTTEDDSLVELSIDGNSISAPEGYVFCDKATGVFVGDCVVLKEQNKNENET